MTVSLMTRFRFETGQLEVLKWIAVALMVGDHINTALFDRQLPVVYEIARIVFPIFAIIFGYNLARPGIDHVRILSRLLLVALIAQPFHVLAFPHGLLPLNVLFTLGVAGIIVWLLQGKPTAFQAVQALCMFALGGLVVDYAWFGILVVLASYVFFRFGSHFPNQAAIAVVGSLVSLYVINGNLYALGALPVIYLVTRRQWGIERSPWAFYALYPAHLALLAAVVWAS